MPGYCLHEMLPEAKGCRGGPCHQAAPESRRPWSSPWCPSFSISAPALEFGMRCSAQSSHKAHGVGLNQKADVRACGTAQAPSKRALLSLDSCFTRSRSPALLAPERAELRLRTGIWSTEFRCKKMIVACIMWWKNKYFGTGMPGLFTYQCRHLQHTPRTKWLLTSPGLETTQNTAEPILSRARKR